MAYESVRLSIVIPTYGREQVLINTVQSLLNLSKPRIEIVLIDQTREHERDVQQRLRAWHDSGAVRRICQSVPSIPKAMNRGALEARGEVLLYLDDDIVPDSGLLTAHLAAHSERCADIIAGRVLQPWHKDAHASEPFTKTTPEMKEEFMGGNFSIRREKLLALGGFDENFKGAAYRFEREFADRLLQAGGTIWYEPSALIRHLHHQSGGTRSRGSHLISWNPRHPVGAYYYLFSSSLVKRRTFKAIRRFFRAMITRHHLMKPWYIPVTMVSELGGLLWALALRLKGPTLPFSQSAKWSRAE